MLILALLKGGDKYGYEISHLIGERGSSVLAVPEGSLYPIFYRLEDEKYITAQKKRVGERRTRVYYHLEPSGEERLAALVKEYQLVSQSIQKLLDELLEE